MCYDCKYLHMKWFLFINNKHRNGHAMKSVLGNPDSIPIVTCKRVTYSMKHNTGQNCSSSRIMSHLYKWEMPEPTNARVHNIKMNHNNRQIQQTTQPLLVFLCHQVVVRHK